MIKSFSANFPTPAGSKCHFFQKLAHTSHDIWNLRGIGKVFEMHFKLIDNKIVYSSNQFLSNH
jgi:hypothetical protein